jgi:outer membrane autotransporter protein
MSADGARGAFDQLSGEVHASAQTALIEGSRFVREAALDRLQSGACGVAGGDTTLATGNTGNIGASCNPTQSVAWGRVLGNWGRNASDGNAARLNRSTGGLLFGADMQAAGHLRVGVMGGFGQTRFDTDARGSGNSTDYHVGLYAGGQWDALALRTGVAYARHDVSTHRSMAIPGVANNLKADYSAGTTQVFGELGYGVQMGATRWEPFANLAYVNVRAKDFTEQSGATALTGQSGSTGTTFSTLGLHASTAIDLGSVQATARGTLGLRHAFGDAAPTSSLTFTGGDAFTVAGVPLARNAAVLGMGLDFKIGQNSTLGISYNGQFGGGVRDNGVRAALSVKF